MQILRFEAAGQEHVGVLDSGKVYDLAKLVPGTSGDMIAVLKAGRALMEQARDALPRAEGIALESVKILSPIERPGKFICMGLNYLEHVKEGGRDIPEYPTLFLRVQTSLLPPDGEILLPKVSEKLDFEAELLVVIGKTAHNVSEDEALDYVYGYTAFNDGSLRDYQRRTTQWTAGKNFDATGPFGPVIVTADELPLGAVGLSIRSRLNGKIMQDGNTKDLMFSVARIISYASEVMTLKPGDVIATGTPSGVGFARNPPVFMKAGDLIEIEIEGIPTLSNRIAVAA
ncbi:fumarylacetoacetate hydrolase family protein [Neorhizobium sp. T786]|uniref:fumarylacetoacetate hydrolase family protein n=1 Tax=Pseudorhizobium xiangyangii TaxID=2883104 RepID=UPI001CFFCBB4|nr:fumarylacetoacetate hydrolase family protein [Neorhizobium xiangyangii]MCB5205438.1 fumarylacetoacetate hydrolase family protein [Neorhizobium xiangyangii]